MLRQPLKKAPPDSYLLPDVRLAQVFDFTPADLAANRGGFLSWGQRYGLGRRGQQRYGGLLRLYWQLARRFVSSVPPSAPVQAGCGRIRLLHQVAEDNVDAKGGKPRITQTYILQINHLRFRLNAAQYQALGNNITYRIYYLPEEAGTDGARLLTLERVEGGCPQVHA